MKTRDMYLGSHRFDTFRKERVMKTRDVYLASHRFDTFRKGRIKGRR